LPSNRALSARIVVVGLFFYIPGSMDKFLGPEFVNAVLSQVVAKDFADK